MAASQETHVFPRPVPGRLFHWVKVASWFELCLFATLLFFWIAPGYAQQTALFGLFHGLGYIGLCVLILVAIIRREAPWPLLAATLTPFGPLGAVIGIELIERKGWGIAEAGIDSAPANRGESNARGGSETLKNSSRGHSRLRGRSRRNSLPGYRRAGVARAAWTPCLPRPRHATTFSGLAERRISASSPLRVARDG
jgi:hypothetical protein